MIKDILESYIKSKEIQKTMEKRLQPGHWQEYVEKKEKIFQPFVESRDYNGLENLLKNFFQNPDLSFGFSENFELPLFMQEYVNWKNFKTGFIKEAEIPDIGNPKGFTVGDFISAGPNEIISVDTVKTNLYSLKFHLLANMTYDIIQNELTVNKNIFFPVIAELGPGYGGLQYYFIKKTTLMTTYISYDLPETNVVLSYYLSQAFPYKKFLLYNKYENQDLEKYDIVILPNWELLNLKDNIVDIFISIRTLGESMNLDTVDLYTDQLLRVTKKGSYFIHERCDKAPSDYLKKIQKEFNLIKKSIALFHNTCNYDYIFKR